MSSVFYHLSLSRWPFRTVPDSESSRLWAGRAGLQAQVERLIWRWGRSDQSTIHLMWADLGAGKSHTLRHIRSRLLETPGSGMYPIYSVMPRELRTFLDVYQAVLAGLDLNRLGQMALATLRSEGSKENLVKNAFPLLPEAVTALVALQAEDEGVRTTAAQWLRGTRGLTKRDLRAIGALRSIRTTDEAVAALSGIMYVVRATEETSRFVVMLDEAQRLGQASNKVRQDVNVGLQTWYDSSPNNLTLIMSFGSGDEDFVRHMVSAELQRREDHDRLRLELFEPAEVVEFVGDLLDQSRSEGPFDKWFPFTEGLVRDLAAGLCKDGGVTAGTIMKAFNAVLTELDYVIGTGSGDCVEGSSLLRTGLEAVGAP